MSDPYYANVSLLLPMNGTNNGTVFTDWSSSPKTITRYNAVTSTSQSKYYGSSGYFDGVGDYLSVANSALGANNLTIEGWIYRSNLGQAHILLDARNADQDSSGLVLYARSTNKLTFGRGNPFVATEGSTTISAGVWHHAALSIESGTARGFLDGVLEFTVSGVTTNFSRTTHRIGLDVSGNSTSPSYYQDIRTTPGIARYTTNFTPPARLVKSISGIVLDTNGSPCARTVYVYDNATGAYLGTTTSDASTGAYEVLCNCSGNEVFRVVMANEATLYNHIIDRVNPG